MECQQCSMPAMVAYENGLISLCIDCDSAFRRELGIKHRQLMDQINFINSEIESIIKAPGSFARFNSEATAETINFQEIPFGTDIALLSLIDSSMVIISDRGQIDLVKPLKQLTEAILHHDELPMSQKNEILEHLSMISVRIAQGEERYGSNLLKGWTASLSAMYTQAKNLLTSKTKSKR